MFEAFLGQSLSITHIKGSGSPPSADILFAHFPVVYFSF